MSTPSDLDQLVEMGFETERAEIALKQSGSLTNAIEWLEKHEDESLDEIKASTTTEGALANFTAASYVCNECGKKFRDANAIQFHAEKSGHSDFGESTEAITPLTEEEKKARLDELRERLKAKREVTSEQDKIDKKRNEQIRMKNTKESQQVKEDLERKEQIKAAQAQRREKQADVDAKARIKAKIEADKEERRRKIEQEKAAREGWQPVIPTTPIPHIPTTAAISSKPSSAYTEARLRLQTSKGNIMKTFPVDTTLFEVAEAVKAEHGGEVASFLQSFPKKVFDQVDFGSTLKELGLVPSAALIL